MEHFAVERSCERSVKSELVFLPLFEFGCVRRLFAERELIRAAVKSDVREFFAVLRERFACLNGRESEVADDIEVCGREVKCRAAVQNSEFVVVRQASRNDIDVVVLDLYALLDTRAVTDLIPEQFFNRCTFFDGVFVNPVELAVNGVIGAVDIDGAGLILFVISGQNLQFAVPSHDYDNSGQACRDIVCTRRIFGRINRNLVGFDKRRAVRLEVTEQTQEARAVAYFDFDFLHFVVKRIAPDFAFFARNEFCSRRIPDDGRSAEFRVRVVHAFFGFRIVFRNTIEVCRDSVKETCGFQCRRREFDRIERVRDVYGLSGILVGLRAVGVVVSYRRYRAQRHVVVKVDDDFRSVVVVANRRYRGAVVCGAFFVNHQCDLFKNAFSFFKTVLVDYDFDVTRSSAFGFVKFRKRQQSAKDFSQHVAERSAGFKPSSESSVYRTADHIRRKRLQINHAFFMSVHALHNRAVFQRYVLTFGVNHLIQLFFAEQFRSGRIRVVHTVKHVVNLCKNVVKTFSVQVDADCRDRCVADRISYDRLVVPPVDLNAFDKSGYRVFQTLFGGCAVACHGVCCRCRAESAKEPQNIKVRNLHLPQCAERQRDVKRLRDIDVQLIVEQPCAY